MSTLKTLGAALMTHELEPYIDWLKAAERDLEVQDFFQHELLDGAWEAKVGEAKALLDGYPGRMGIHGPFWGLHLANPDTLLRKTVTQRLLQGLAAAEGLGATHMVIHSPVDPWMHRHMLNNKAQKDKVIGLVKETLAEPLEKAESIGCILVMEDIMDLDPRLQLDIIHANESDYLRMSIDVGHAFCMHIQHAAPPPDQFIAEAGKYLEHVHIQDNDGYIDRHWLPGEGNINFKAIIEELDKLEHNPRLIIEVKEKARVKEAANYLESLVSNK